MKRNFFLFSCLLMLFPEVRGQGDALYQSCKERLKKGAYEEAVTCFREYLFLYGEEGRQYYLGLYEGTALHALGQHEKAEERWKQIVPEAAVEWKKSEISFHFGKNVCEQGNLLEGFTHFSSLTEEYFVNRASVLEREYVARAEDIGEITSLFREFPTKPFIGERLLELLMRAHTQGRALPSLNEQREHLQRPIRMKNEYHLALLLPFTHREETDYLLNNPSVVDIYRAVKMAMRETNLEENGDHFFLHTYDTKGNPQEVMRILHEANEEEIDLIIGPLHRETTRAASSFSKKERINILHPISINAELGQDNAYFFFAKATYPTQAEVLKDYVSAHLTEKKVAIFYQEQHKDLIIAQAYAKKVQEEGFEVVTFRGFAVEHAGLLKEEMLAPPLPTHEEVPSEGAEYALGVGHIFLSASHPIFLANLMSAVEIRQDKLPVFTDEKFLTKGGFSLGKMEKLKICFVSPLFFGNSSAKRAFVESYLADYAVYPSPYAFVAYEALYAWTHLLNRTGTYVQNDFRLGKKAPGKMTDGLDYGLLNDNQQARILQVRGGKVVAIYP